MQLFTAEMRYHQWLEIWSEFYKKPFVQPKTFESLQYFLRIMKRFAADIPISEIDEIYCQKILNDLFTDNYSKASIKKIRTILCQSLNRPIKTGIIFRNPVADLIIPNAPTKVVCALTREEQKLVEDASYKVKYGYMFRFLLYTGLRRNEATHLEFRDYNARTQEIFIRASKTKSGIRTVPLIAPASEIIKAQSHYPYDDFIFHTLSGSVFTESVMKKTYEEIRRITGIQTLTNHVCRHTFATRLVEQGASPKSVASLLGHARVEYALNIYTNLEKEQLRKEIFLLEHI